jgi:hypothetical protein
LLASQRAQLEELQMSDEKTVIQSTRAKAEALLAAAEARLARLRVRVDERDTILDDYEADVRDLCAALRAKMVRCDVAERTAVEIRAIVNQMFARAEKAEERATAAEADVARLKADLKLIAGAQKITAVLPVRYYTADGADWRDTTINIYPRQSPADGPPRWLVYREKQPVFADAAADALATALLAERAHVEKLQGQLRDVQEKAILYRDVRGCGNETTVARAEGEVLRVALAIVDEQGDS